MFQSCERVFNVANFVIQELVIAILRAHRKNLNTTPCLFLVSYTNVVGLVGWFSLHFVGGSRH